MSGLVNEFGFPITSQGYMSKYEAANYSARRSTIPHYFGSLDRRVELDRLSRDEMYRRIDWLCANVGFVKGFVKKAAILVGYGVPSAETADTDWNERATEHMEERLMNRGVFDLGGRFDYRTSQMMLSRVRMTAGDGLTVAMLARSGRRIFKHYESTQLGNPKGADESWRDGVRVGRHGRHLAYGVKTASGGVDVIPAEACFYFGEFDYVGQNRAVPGLAHSVNHASDITDIWADVKTQIKLASQYGLVRTKDSAAPRGASGVPGPPAEVYRPVSSTPGAGGGGGEVGVERKEVFGGPNIIGLDSGEDIKELGSRQPSDEVSQFISNTLLRDIANGDGLSEAAVWHICKMTGPEVRFLMESLRAWIDERQLALAEWCRWTYAMALSNELQSGALPFPKGDDKWWQMGLTWRRDMTIDSGRDGRHQLEEVNKTLVPKSVYTSRNLGKRRSTVVKQVVAERVAEAKAVDDNPEAKRLGLTWRDCFGSEKMQEKEAEGEGSRRSGSGSGED